MTVLKTAARRARTLAWTAVSIVVILAAVGVGVGKLLMPYTARYQPQLEAWLSREFGRPVVLDGFDGEWNAFGPRLRLRGMRLHSPDGSAPEVAIEEAALDLKPFNALIPGRAWYNFLVIGANFRLVRNDDGSFALSGLGAGSAGDKGSSGGLRNLVGIGELTLENSSLEFEHPARGIHIRLTSIDARVQLDDESAALRLSAELGRDEPGQTFGEVDATALLKFSRTGRIASARWHLGVRDLLLDPLRGRLTSSRLMPEEGLVNGVAWGDWLDGEPLAVRGIADLQDGRLGHGEDAIRVERAHARIGWIYGGRGDWRLDLHELQVDGGAAPWRAPNVALARNLSGDVGLWIGADLLPLDVSLRLTRDILSLYGTAWPEFLPESVEGSVSGLDLVLDSRWRMKFARGQARGAAVEGWGRWPGLYGVDAAIDFDGGVGAIELQSPGLEVRWPRMFGEALQFSLPACRVGLDTGRAWQVSLRDCRLFNEDLALAGDLSVAGNGGRPVVDANFAVSRGAIGALSRYWPQGIMKPKVVAWLREGLLAGEIDEARFQIRGDMDDWPFRNQRGRFEAWARVSGASVAYAPRWPRITGLDGELHFVGPSMHVGATGGAVGGVPVQAASARIDDFRKVVLRVDYESSTTLPALIGFLQDSPILGEARDTLGRFEFAGPAQTRGTIEVPLGQAPGQLRVDGRASVEDGAFFDPASGTRLTEVSGELRYDRAGLTGEGLRALYRESPAVLHLAASAAGAERFRATLEGEFDVDTVLPDFLRDIDPLTRLSGTAPWKAAVVVPAAGGVPWLDVESSLEGVSVDLPDPLRKAAGGARPVRLRYPLSGATRLMELDFDRDSRLRLEIEPAAGTPDSLGGILRGAVGLGGAIPALPAPGLLRIEGRPRWLDLDGWIDLVTDRVRAGGLGELDLERCAVRAGEMRFLDRQFLDVGIELAVDPAEIRAQFDGSAIDGSVLFTPGQRGGSLTAEFERLALDKPVKGGISMRSNPADLPELHLYARSFRYAGIEMGETRIEAYPAPGGFHFEKVEAESPELNLRATGDWLMLEDGPRSDFRILVTTESLGRFLESVGISSSLEGGQTMLRFSAWWPGTPAAFALSRLNGEVEFSVTRGQITNANPGSGRLLGLLSIQALPRRLSLDFRDVFDSGFDFEEAHGTFRMENGTASTDDVELSSSAARISLRGSTDLVAQRYDQVMTVQPGLGNTLPALGAIAGGPAGAAAGLALQGLLHDQLGEATQVQYTITGSWDEPSIEPILKTERDGEPVVDGP